MLKRNILHPFDLFFCLHREGVQSKATGILVSSFSGEGRISAILFQCMDRFAVMYAHRWGYVSWTAGLMYQGDSICR